MNSFVKLKPLDTNKKFEYSRKTLRGEVLITRITHHSKLGFKPYTRHLQQCRLYSTISSTNTDILQKITLSKKTINSEYLATYNIPQITNTVDRFFHVKSFLNSSLVPLPEWFGKESDCRLRGKSMLENYARDLSHYALLLRYTLTQV